MKVGVETGYASSVACLDRTQCLLGGVVEVVVGEAEVEIERNYSLVAVVGEAEMAGSYSLKAVFGELEVGRHRLLMLVASHEMGETRIPFHGLAGRD